MPSAVCSLFQTWLRHAADSIIDDGRLDFVGSGHWQHLLAKGPFCKPYLCKKYKEIWTQEGFRVHTSRKGYHLDGAFCVVKPGCIVSLCDVQNYALEFPNWDVLHLPDQSWQKVSPFLKMKDKVGGRWWLKGEEHNDQLISFVNKTNKNRFLLSI